MDYKRLTKKSVDDGTVQIGYAERIVGCYHKDKIILERLAELEDKIEQGTMIELPCVLKPYYLCGEWHCKIMIGFDKNSVPIMEYFHGKEKETVVSKAEKRLKELQNG